MLSPQQQLIALEPPPFFPAFILVVPHDHRHPVVWSPAHMDRIFKGLDQIYAFLAVKVLLLTHYGPLQFVRGIRLLTISY